MRSLLSAAAVALVASLACDPDDWRCLDAALGECTPEYLPHLVTTPIDLVYFASGTGLEDGITLEFVKGAEHRRIDLVALSFSAPWTPAEAVERAAEGCTSCHSDTTWKSWDIGRPVGCFHDHEGDTTIFLGVHDGGCPDSIPQANRMDVLVEWRSDGTPTLRDVIATLRPVYLGDGTQTCSTLFLRPDGNGSFASGAGGTAYYNWIEALHVYPPERPAAAWDIRPNEVPDEIVGTVRFENFDILTFQTPKCLGHEVGTLD